MSEKSLIGAVLANNNNNHNNNNNNNHSNNSSSSNSAPAGATPPATGLPSSGENINDRSTDSCTALLLEHKSLVPASGRGNSSSSSSSSSSVVRWKKLGQSFRRVLSAGRMSAASSSSSCSLSTVAMTTASTLNCIQVAPPDDRKLIQLDEEEKENSGREEGNYNNNNNINIAKEVAPSDGGARNTSPTPTSRYVNGPRCSTPRKTLPAATSSSSSAASAGGRRRRRCSHLEDGDQQPTLRVHWADSNDHLNHADKPSQSGHFRSADNLHNPTAVIVLSFSFGFVFHVSRINLN